MSFTFNRNYKDLDQVAAYLDEFTEIYDEIVERTGRGFAYNDDFKGRIPAIEGPCEDTAIYLLQTLRRQREQDAKVAALLEDGYEHIDRLDGEQRFAHVIFYSESLGDFRGEWHGWRNARLIPEDHGAQAEVTGKIRAVLPKGKLIDALAKPSEGGDHATRVVRISHTSGGLWRAVCTCGWEGDEAHTSMDRASWDADAHETAVVKQGR